MEFPHKVPEVHDPAVGLKASVLPWSPKDSELTDVSRDQCHVTQAGVGLVGALGQRLGSA